MDQTALERVIDDAFEQRAGIGVGHRPGRCATRSRRLWTAWTPAGSGSRRRSRAAGACTSGSRRRCCCRFASIRCGPIEGGPGGARWWDKVPSKFAGWDAARFTAAGFRAVPGCIVRHSAYIAPDVVLMPCFVNLGAYVDSGTMIDTWATVGSCAQIGRNVHISGGAGIGGVLEPLQAGPVIIEDDCFIGARSEVAEGVIVEQGAVLAMGVFIGASTKIVDRTTGEIHQGRVPAYSVVVPGTLPGPALPDGRPGPSLACAVIVKRVDAGTRAKTSINELLRA